MDIDNFVPQTLKDYYDTSGCSSKDLNNSLETREPYKSVSRKSSRMKQSRNNKRGTQQFNFSRNCINLSLSNGLNYSPASTWYYTESDK